jgi:hypothetical protein
MKPLTKKQISWAEEGYSEFIARSTNAHAEGGEDILGQGGSHLLATLEKPFSMMKLEFNS